MADRTQTTASRPKPRTREVDGKLRRRFPLSFVLFPQPLHAVRSRFAPAIEVAAQRPKILARLREHYEPHRAGPSMRNRDSDDVRRATLALSWVCERRLARSRQRLANVPPFVILAAKRFRAMCALSCRTSI